MADDGWTSTPRRSSRATSRCPTIDGRVRASRISSSSSCEIGCMRDGASCGSSTRPTFALDAGASLGIVGESGSGKTMLCRSFIGTLPRYGVAITGGRLHDRGRRHDARHRAGLAADPRAGDRVRAAELAGRAEPGADGRDAAARGAPHRAAQPVGVAGARRGTPAARPGPDPARRQRPQRALASAVGRHEAAGDDRRGARADARRCWSSTSRRPPST